MAELLFTCMAVFLVMSSAFAWDPDAGMIQSYTKVPGHVTVSASSGVNPNQIVDGDDNTNWVSGSCLPSFYIKRPDVNVIYGACADGLCTSTSGSNNDLTHATDGDVYTVATIQKGTTSATFTITLQVPTTLRAITVNGVYTTQTTLYSYVGAGSQRQQLQVFTSAVNYQNINTFNLTGNITKLEMVSDSSFKIKFIAAIGPSGCHEEVTVDLGSLKSVGTIRTRHWAGTNAASALELRVSADKITWTPVASLDPSALRPVTTSLPEQHVRYISLRYTVNMVNYMKVYCYEVDAWAADGIWGPKIAAKPQKISFRQLLGVNGIWGWGNNKYSNSLGANEGPLLYSQIASHARNYHNLIWDVTDPDLDPEYSEMAAGRGTQAMWWLNWDTEYTAWKAANMSTDISIQFTAKTFPQSVWDTPEQSAFHYGTEFAKHFGAAVGNGLADAVEIGNEPWDYDAAFYATILRGMSAGIRSIDNIITVVAGTFQAQDKLETNTYIGTRVLPDAAGNIDVINCHTYSFVNDDSGVRRGTYPENKQSSFNNVRPLTRWRDTNTPTKSLWVTEWGWDAAGQGEHCVNTECVSERAQAVYAIRGLLILARANVERATWFFYANTDCETLFCRSGLTTSIAHHFQKKTVFSIFEDFLAFVGDSYFLATVQENDNGYIYAFSNSSKAHEHVDRTNSATILSMATHVIAWLPVDIDDTISHHVTIRLPAKTHAMHGVRFTGSSVTQASGHDHSYSQIDDMLNLRLTTEPVLVELCRPKHSAGPIVG